MEESLRQCSEKISSSIMHLISYKKFESLFSGGHKLDQKNNAPKLRFIVPIDDLRFEYLAIDNRSGKAESKLCEDLSGALSFFNRKQAKKLITN